MSEGVRENFMEQMKFIGTLKGNANGNKKKQKEPT